MRREEKGKFNCGEGLVLGMGRGVEIWWKMGRC
jgi:hypothetical protein